MHLLRSHAYLLLAALLLLPGVGCDSHPGYDHTYTTRGIIKSLPGEKATQEFIIHHETIPHYQSINGSVGMNEMMMPISVPDRSVLDGLAIGDKVELTFGERFEPTQVMEVIAVTKLPDDAELNLSVSAKPQAVDKAAGHAENQIDLAVLLGTWESDSINTDQQSSDWHKPDRIRLVIDTYESIEGDDFGNPYGDGRYRVSMFEKRPDEDFWSRTGDSRPGGVDNRDPDNLVLRLGPIGSHLVFDLSVREETIELRSSDTTISLKRIDPKLDADNWLEVSRPQSTPVE